MEASTQSVQRAIIQNALAQIRGERTGFHYFNELLVQQFVRGHLVRVVPDTMVVLGDLADRPRTCYQPEDEVPLFWVLEYVSASSPNNKEYTDKRQRYEEDLQVPYYLIYDPEAAPFILSLYHYEGAGYQLVKANEQGRFPIPELKLEVGLVDGWTRLWFQGRLLPLTEELAARMKIVEREIEELTRANQQLTQDKKRLTEDKKELTKANEDLEAGLRQRDERLTALAMALRPVVEQRARQAGRQDILDALSAADPDTLTRWLTELS
jgi:Uma2 family endonuclease/FtsZ-binding cell division protein ZapB